MLLLAACDEPASADAPQSASPDVGIVTVKAEPFALMRELPGRIAPTRVADVRPRVSGFVQKVAFAEARSDNDAAPLIAGTADSSWKPDNLAKPASDLLVPSLPTKVPASAQLVVRL